MNQQPITYAESVIETELTGIALVNNPILNKGTAFTEPVIRAMAKHVDRPIIFPLSNPTSRSDATPEQLMAWTEGRALIRTGSPFPPVHSNGRTVMTDETNNSYIFPGVGLGVVAVGARRVTDAMFMAAGRALANMSPTKIDKNGRLLPHVDQLRSVAVAVATAVARKAQADSLADPCDDEALARRIRDHIWEPVYRPFRKRA